MLGLLAAGACTADLKPPYRAFILDRTGYGGELAIAARDLPYLQDLEELRGPWFDVKSGAIRVRSELGSLVSGDIDAADPPSLQYTVNNNVIVPRDYTTLGALTAHHVFHRVYADWEALTGLTPAFFAQTYGPFPILFEPAYEQGNTTEGIKQNAFFDFQAFAFGLAQRSSAEDVPIGLRSEVIAHELGHAVFQHFFYLGGGTANVPLVTGNLALAGLNEGFADYFAFVSEGVTVREIASWRDLRAPGFTFDQYIEDGGVCPGSFYCAGLAFSASLYDLAAFGTGATERERHQAVLRTVVDVLTRVATGLTPASPPDCNTFSAECLRRAYADLPPFLNAFATELPAPLQSPFCDAARAHFGPTTVSPSAVPGCGVPL